VEAKLKRIQDAKIEEKRQEALKRMEESTKWKQAEEEIAQIYHPENQAKKVLSLIHRCLRLQNTNLNNQQKQFSAKTAKI
jgi:hypothetical protein